IAAILNEEGLTTDWGRPWTRATVHWVLTNEKYIGNNVFNRVSFKLKKKRVVNSPDMWIRAEGAFPAIVEPELFDAAQATVSRRNRRRLPDAEMLDRLRELCAQRGTLSSVVIDEANELPSSAAYSLRFGGLMRAYQLVGYTGRD